MLAGGAYGLADSRLDNFDRIYNAGFVCHRLLLRLPHLSEADRVVATVDVSLNSELDVIEELSICVANMPGAYSRTSTMALNNATIGYALQLANKGVEAIKSNLELKKGLNVYKGMVTYKAVAEAWNLDFVDVDEALKQ